MKQVKCDLEKKMQDLGKKSRENKIKNGEKNKRNEKICINEKICPFMTSPDEQVACTSQCKIYREDKGEYGCAFSELTSISWSLSGKKKKKKN